MQPSDQNSNIAKSWIVKQSGCVAATVVQLVFAIICTVCAFLFIVKYDAFIVTVCGCLCAGLALWVAILLSKNVFIILKILCNKYTVHELTVQDVRARRSYIAGHSCDRMLVFENMNVTVDNYTSQKFSAGSKCILVFLDGVKYPIVIANRKEYQSKNS